MRTAYVMAAVAIGITALPVHAQSGPNDVVVMRRVIAPPNRARPITPTPTPVPTPTYAGTWSLSPTIFRTSCDAKQRETYYPAICTGPGGSVDTTQSACDPATRPDVQRTTEACTANCQAFRGGYYYQGSRFLGTVNEATDVGKQAAAKAMCEKANARINSFNCTLQSNTGSRTGSVYISDSYSDTFSSGSANYYFTASCRTT